MKDKPVDGQLNFFDFMESFNDSQESDDIIKLVIPADRRAIGLKEIPEQLQLLPVSDGATIRFERDHVDYAISMHLPEDLEERNRYELKDVSLNFQEFMRIVAGVKTLLDHHYEGDSDSMKVSLRELTNWFFSAESDENGGRYFSDTISSVELKQKIHKAILMMQNSNFVFHDKTNKSERSMQFAHVTYDKVELQNNKTNIIYTFEKSDNTFISFSRAKYLTMDSKKMLFGQVMTKGAGEQHTRRGARGHKRIYQYDSCVSNAFLIIERSVSAVMDSGKPNGSYMGELCHVAIIRFEQLYEVLPINLAPATRKIKTTKIYNAVTDFFSKEKENGGILNYELRKSQSLGRGNKRPDTLILYIPLAETEK